jgi:short-subunit dehydrogenase
MRNESLKIRQMREERFGTKRGNRCQIFLNLIAFLILLELSIFLSISVYNHFLRQPTSWKAFNGDWALVTGASYGIGEAYCLELAKRGLNVILVARSQDKLEKVEQNIKKMNPTSKTKIIVADFTKDPYLMIEQAIEGLNVSVLVNNVGGVSIPEDQMFSKYPFDAIHDDAELNLESSLLMTRLILPQMQARNKGRILSVSSLTHYGYPFSAVYASSKSALLSWNNAVRRELISAGYDGIEMVVTPLGFVDTPLLRRQENVDEIPFKCEASELVEEELNQFGTKSEMIAHLNHIATWLPVSLLAKLPQAPALSIFRLAFESSGFKFPAKESITKEN